MNSSSSDLCHRSLESASRSCFIESQMKPRISRMSRIMRKAAFCGGDERTVWRDYQIKTNSLLDCFFQSHPYHYPEKFCFLSNIFRPPSSRAEAQRSRSKENLNQ
jgi:hypothetical protein